MKKLSNYLFIFLIAFAILLSGCPSAVIQAPSFTNNKSSTTPSGTGNSSSVSVWGAPEDLVVSKGLQGRIELSWKAVKGAVKYNIYESSSAYTSTYSLRAVTTENSFVISDCLPGTDAYYIVKAVKKNGAESPASLKVQGSSLAQPFINHIAAGETSYSSNVVYWAMENVSSYQSDVRYSVYCYDEQTSGNLVQQIDVDGSVTDATKVTFNNLNQNTTYWYYVEAYNVKEPEKKENSGARVDETTTRKTTPNAVVNFTATKGTSLDTIHLTFELPEPVDVIVGSSSYETYPLYFKIYRKSFAQVDGVWVASDDYQLIHTMYPGDKNLDDHALGANESNYYSKYTPENVDEPYEVGRTITYDDVRAAVTNPLNPEYRYNYKIVSYAFYRSRNIVGNEPATDDGFLAHVPNLSADITSSTLDSGTPGKYSSVKVTCSVSDIADGYIGNDCEIKFYLGTMFTSIEGSTSYTYEQVTFQSATFSKVYTYEDLATQHGYYKYRLYVFTAPKTIAPNTPFESVTTDDLIGYVQSVGELLVYENIARPETKSFAVTNGYSDRVLLAWDAASGIDYTVTFTPYNGVEETVWENKAAGTGYTETVSGEDGSLTYTLPADTTCRGSFTLYANDASSGVHDSNTIAGYTLGKANVSTVARDYKDIQIAFAPVTGASAYDISYVSPVDGSTVEFTDVSNEFIYVAGQYTYTIEDIEGYENPLKAGNDISVSVKARCPVVKNSGAGGATSTPVGTNSETVATIQSNLLGPASSEMTAQVSKAADRIVVTFQKTEGAKYYYLFRERLAMSGNEPSYENVTAVEGVYTSDYDPTMEGDGYILDFSSSQDTPVVTSLGGAFDSSKVTVSVSGTKVTLTEITEEEPESAPSVWQKNQDRMRWGYPFRYLAFPVTNTSTIYNPATHQLVNSDSGDLILQYDYSKNPDSIMKRGSTYGYGTDVIATKSADPHKVTISYTIPYGSASVNPYLYRREWSPSNNGTYTREATSGTAGSSTFTRQLTEADRTSAFEYAVAYSEGTLYKSYVKALAANLMKDAETEGNYAAYTDPDTGVTTYEPFNKGYAFAIEMSASNVPALDGNEGYKEQVSFTPWDYSVRAIGPSENAQYNIEICNMNLGAGGRWYSFDQEIPEDWDGWFRIASINQEGTLTSTALNDAVDHDNYQWHMHAYLTNTANSVTIAPLFGLNNDSFEPSTPTTNFDSDPYTTYTYEPVHVGILRVLRDYKHYYRVRLVREMTVGNEDVEMYASYADADDATFDSLLNYTQSASAIYTYRKISEGELLQCASLILADMFYQAGIPKNGGFTGDYDSNTITGANSASFTVKHKGGANSMNWGSSGYYQHIFFPGISSIAYCSDSTKQEGTSGKNSVGASGNAKDVYIPTTMAYKFNSSFTVNIPNVEGGRAFNNALYGIADNYVSIKHETGMHSYQGSMRVRTGTTSGNDHNNLVWEYYSPYTDDNDDAHFSLIFAHNDNSGSIDAINIFPYWLTDGHKAGIFAYDEGGHVGVYSAGARWWQ